MTLVDATALTVSTASVPLIVRWTRVDAGLWVASRGGAHLGRVDAVAPGRFVAYSGSGIRLGEHPALAPARAAVELAG